MAAIVAAVSVVRVIRFALQPRWLAWHLLLVVVLVSFTWLGRWQLGASSTRAATRPARPGRTAALDRLTAPGGRLAAGDVGRRVRGDRQLRRRTAPGWSPAGTGPAAAGTGFLVVSPLRTGRGVLPVVRGWVARHDDRRGDRADGRR